ncbi:competence/damage-inducible protein A [Microvirgula aerodenitrificans]|uniref:competence/damage-inducible protein A n=1 Tax=Microvirgula aerodenitrificans TaxID=57480 RepID=UPI00048F27AC|nr:competence/damage-inducible protein A [Microvirgula aerodenitrificans]
MKVGAIIIGDELLSGKRQDKHLQALIRILAARGMRLHWAEYLADSPEAITATLKRTLAGDDLVFSFGGIGATPDDYTRACAAAAAGVELETHADGRAILEARFGEEAYPHRIHMVDFPTGSRLIPNPVNQIPGFSVGNHHFVPGFPSMAWPMIEWVLDTHYRGLFNDEPDVEHGFVALQAREGDLIGLMEEMVARYPALRLSCLPSFGTADLPPHIEFGLTGAPALVDIGVGELRRAVEARGYETRDRKPR